MVDSGLDGVVQGEEGTTVTDPDDDLPTMRCPQCKAEHPDFDGFGMVAHIKPAYPDGCGYCTHASLTGGVCDYCGLNEAGGFNERLN